MAIDEWEYDKAHHEILAWLDAQAIAYGPRLSFWSDGLIAYPYQGHIFVNVPCDPYDVQYQQLSAYLEDEHGRCVHEGVGYHVMPLDKAMSNVHHDTEEYQDDLLDKC